MVLESKLNKLKMPEKKKPMNMAALGANESSSEDEEEAAPMDLEEEGMVEESENSSMLPELEAVSDEDLMAELKKRGLLGKLDESEAEEEASYEDVIE